MARYGLIILALLWAFTGHAQNQRMASLFVTSGMTTAVFRATSTATFAGGTLNSAGETNSSHSVNNAWVHNSLGVTNRSATPTRQDAPLLINGAFALAPTLQVGLAIDQSTNAYKYYVTNANLTFTFTGTPLDGARGQMDIKNTGATNITVGWPSSWSIAQSALVTSFIASSNTITEVFWYNEGGSNRVRVATKEIVANFVNVQPGQVRAFHDANTETNLTLAGTGDVTAAAGFGTDNVAIRSDGTGKGVQASGVVIEDDADIHTPAGLRGLTVIGTNSITSQGTLTVTGASALGGNVTTTNIDANAIKLTNNVTYVINAMVPSGALTNFAGNYLFGWNDYLMTNHFHLTGMVNVAGANLARPYLVKLRNYSGAALTASVSASFRRSGTNFVSVGNNQACDVIVTPDGTGGVNETNQHAQITVYNSP